MTRPLSTGKPSVNLAKSDAPVSRIRRDPPPVVKEITILDTDEREARVVVIGVVTFALALAVIAIGLSYFAGWSPRQHTIHIKL